jgi:hypothetical protein
MFNLPAAIRNHFVLVPYFEAKTASSRSSKEILVPIAKAAPGASSPSAVVPDPSTALRTRLRSAEIETTTPSTDSSFVSLAGKAPAVCSQLQKIGR